MSSGSFDDSAETQSRATFADFLGLLACLRVTAFQQRGRDILLSATAADMSAIGMIAVAEIGHFQMLCDRLSALGVDPDEAMRQFQQAAVGYERRTIPGDRLESLVKLYLGDALAADFHRHALPHIDSHGDAESKRLVKRVLSSAVGSVGGGGTFGSGGPGRGVDDMDGGDDVDDAGDAGSDGGGDRARFAVDRITAATGADQVTADRLSLWARRLTGEVLARTQAMIAVRPGLAALFVGMEGVEGADVAGDIRPDADPAAIARVFTRATRRHTQRVRDLGLTP